MKTLLTVMAIIEAAAGLALAGVPSTTAWLLFEAPLGSAAAVGMARIGGAAILALAIICWLAPRHTHGPVARSVIVAMLFYNFAVAFMLAFAGFGQGPRHSAVARGDIPPGDRRLVRRSATSRHGSGAQ
jgi:hypothetical protein